MSSPMMRTFGSRSISSIIASRIASRYDFSLILVFRYRARAMLRDDVGEQLRRFRCRALLGEFDRFGGLPERPLIHLLHVVVRQSADLGEAIAKNENGVAMSVLLDFVLGAVRLEDVRRAMAGEAVRHGLDAVRLARLP